MAALQRTPAHSPRATAPLPVKQLPKGHRKVSGFALHLHQPGASVMMWHQQPARCCCYASGRSVFWYSNPPYGGKLLLSALGNAGRQPQEEPAQQPGGSLPEGYRSQAREVSLYERHAAQYEQHSVNVAEIHSTPIL